MSTNEGSGPSDSRAGRSRARRKGITDLRIRRTRGRLGDALIALVEEKAMHRITVRGVLDRAGVGRSTFYVHYQDKDDLFLSLQEEGLQMWSNILSNRQEKSGRVAPVANSLRMWERQETLSIAGRLRPYPGVFRSGAGLFRARYRQAPEGDRFRVAGSAGTRRPRPRSGGQSAGAFEMVAGSRDEGIGGRYGRSLSSDGLEGPAIANRVRRARSGTFTTPIRYTA